MTEQATITPIIKRLERSRSDRMVAGVCGGLARYFDIHPAFYRVGFVVLTLLGGSGILIYVAAALVIPDEGREESLAEEVLRDHRNRPWPLIGLGIIALGSVVVLSNATFWPNGGLAWLLALLAGGAILWARRGDLSRPRRVMRTIVVSVLLLAALVLGALAIFVSSLHVALSHGVGDRTYGPVAAADVRRSYHLGMGDLRLDLGRIALPPGETRVRARVDVGDLRIVVPADASVRITADASWGDLTLLGRHEGGHDVTNTLVARVPGAGGTLVVDAHVGLGNLRVVRAVR
jgi:phage shock protein PspC (stress-responsive transcriptional regulator)